MVYKNASRPAAALMLATLALPFAAGAASYDTALGPVEVTEIAGDFTNPWAVERLPDGGFLVTEIAGRLWHVGADGRRTEVSGVPEVVEQGQGGLLDVMIPRDFAESRQVFLSYAKAQPSGAGTALAVGVLNGAGDALEDVTQLFEMREGGNRGQHFGSRIVEGSEGHLFLTIGERGMAERAQDLDRHNGTVVRLNRDGSVPEDNPFVDTEGALPEIWSYGHRNPQGASLDADGQLWVVEHGARGGDEVNRVEPGVNFGWPVISYGTNYDGSPIGEGTEKDGMAQPAFYWDPSIAPSGFAAPAEGPLDGHFVIGSLKFNSLSVLNPSDWSEETLSFEESIRVRDVIPGPDGTIWFLSEVNGAVYELRVQE